MPNSASTGELELRTPQHSSIDHTIDGITSDLNISPKHCRTLAKGASIKLRGRWIGGGGIARPLSLKSLVTQEAPTGITAN